MSAPPYTLPFSASLRLCEKISRSAFHLDIGHSLLDIGYSLLLTFYFLLIPYYLLLTPSSFLLLPYRSVDKDGEVEDFLLVAFKRLCPTQEAFAALGGDGERAAGRTGVRGVPVADGQALGGHGLERLVNAAGIRRGLLEHLDLVQLAQKVVAMHRLVREQRENHRAHETRQRLARTRALLKVHRLVFLLHNVKNYSIDISSVASFFRLSFLLPLKPWQPLVGVLHGAEGVAVFGAGAVSVQRGDMLADAVALVRVEAVVRIVRVKSAHEMVAGDFGDDAGGGDEETLRIAAHNRRGRAGQSLHGEAVNQNVTDGHAQRLNCSAHGGVRGDENIEVVNLLRGGDADCPFHTLGLRQLPEALLALRGRELLGVGEFRERTGV